VFNQFSIRDKKVCKIDSGVFIDAPLQRAEWYENRGQEVHQDDVKVPTRMSDGGLKLNDEVGSGKVFRQLHAPRRFGLEQIVGAGVDRRTWRKSATLVGVCETVPSYKVKSNR
jgi:hypothetical protein